MKKLLWIFLLISYSSLFSTNAFAQYQCFVRDKGGHMWASDGSTEDRATTVAMSFCSAYSPNSSTCEFNRCITH